MFATYFDFEASSHSLKNTTKKLIYKPWLALTQIGYFVTLAVNWFRRLRKAKQCTHSKLHDYPEI